MQFTPVTIDYIKSVPINARKPACYDTVLDLFNSGEPAAEITAWQDKYATRDTVYAAVLSCVKRYFPDSIKAMKSGKPHSRRRQPPSCAAGRKVPAKFYEFANRQRRNFRL